MAKDDFDTLDSLPTIHGDDGTESKLLADRYRIIRKLGEGGMGMVYLAEDTELGNEKVAIKFIPPIMAGNPRAIKNLKKEAQTARQLSHPNIVRLHDLHTDGQQKFLVMEYIDGKTLEQILVEKEDDRLSLEEIMPIAEQIAAGLDYAHSCNVLHRDLKPSNIMIDKSGRVKILDFGIAREMKDSFTMLTGKDTSGTLPYMSPEQLRGKPPAPSMDIYSLAAVLYECLSGHPPFYSGNLMYQILEEEPASLPEVPERVNKSLLNALSKEASNRPKSAHEFIEMIKKPEDIVEQSCAEPLSEKKEIPPEEESGIEPQEDKVKEDAIVESIEEKFPVKEEISQKEEIQKASTYDDISQESEEKRPEGIAPKEEVSLPPILSWKAPVGILIVLLIVGGVLLFKFGRKTEKGHNLSPSYELILPRKSTSPVTGKTKPDTSMPKMGHLSINTEPKDAHIRILNRNFHYSNGMALEAGSYKVEVSSPGYETDTRWIDLKEGESTWINIGLKRLNRRLMTRLYVDAKPADARIRILNIAPRYSPGIELEPGAYEIEVSCSGYQTYKQWVSLTEGENKMSVQLEKVKAEKSSSTIIVSSINYKMVYIPPGTFMMGSPGSENGRDNDETQYKVSISKGFYIGTTEVTVEQFKRFINDTGYRTASERGDGSHAWIQGKWEKKKDANWKHPYFDQKEDCPVCCVSWDDVVAFCDWLIRKTGEKYRLPTEAEWEYACRAGSSKAFSNGGITETNCGYEPNLDRMGWYCGNSNGTTHSVAKKRPNSWGIFDMHGNVWEWCQDWYAGYPSGSVKNPSGPLWGAGRVVRGGCWGRGAWNCRSAERNYYAQSYSESGLGFRLARTP